MLMREVDDAVRADEAVNVARQYGVPIGVALALCLASFGGWLYWRDSQEKAKEEQSEALIKAMDELDAGNLDAADGELALLAEDGGPGARASALMRRASIAIEQGNVADGVAMFDQVANDTDAPQAMRDAATLRSVSLNYDNLDPQAVIDRAGPLAVAGNAWFGSAGELVAMAYLAQGKEDQAGPLLVQIAQDEAVPQTLRSRTRQLAGVLGYDAVEDVEADAKVELQPDAEAPAQ